MRPDTRRFNKRTVTSASEDTSVPQAGNSCTALHQQASRPLHVTSALHEREKTQRRPDPRVTTKGRDRRYALYQGKSRHT